MQTVSTIQDCNTHSNNHCPKTRYYLQPAADHKKILNPLVSSCFESYQFAARSHERTYPTFRIKTNIYPAEYPSLNSTLPTRNESKTKQHDSSRMEFVQKGGGDEILCSRAVNIVPRVRCVTPLRPNISLQLNTDTRAQTLQHPAGVHYSSACVRVL